MVFPGEFHAIKLLLVFPQEFRTRVNSEYRLLVESGYDRGKV
jgi:hypothetical protein